MSKKFFLALLLCLLPVSAPRHAKDTHQSKAVREDLIESYQRFNNGWFNGELPQDTKIEYSDMGPDYPIGLTTQIGDNFSIFINAYDDRNVREAELTEFHEMCHVWVATHGDEFEEHGPKWVGCMRGLAAAGAFDDLW